MRAIKALIIISETPNDQLTEKIFSSNVSSIINQDDKPRLCWMYKPTFTIVNSCFLKIYINGYVIITKGIIKIAVIIDAGKKTRSENIGNSYLLNTSSFSG